MPNATDSLTTASAIAAPTTWTRQLLRALALLLALGAGLYGVMAINTGYVNFKGAGNADVAAARLEMRRAAEAGEAAAPAAIASHSGIYLAMISELTSPRYAYGAQGLSEPMVHYAEMPARNGQVLALHNVMGGLLMLFGGLQFWPALRRRYPRWHRAFGMVYVGAATIGMVAAMAYLTLTPVAQVYDTFTFTAGLWFLATGVLASIGMSMYHLRRREIAQHQAYMAISYGLLLTAPLQRYLWVAVGMRHPEMRQLEGNFAVTAWLIPFSFLVGYGIFTVNRLLQERKPAALLARDVAAFPRARALGQVLTWVLLPLLALGVLATVQHFLVAPGMNNYPLAAGLVPAGVVALDAAVIGQDLPGRLLFVLATSAGLLLGGRLLWQAFLRPQALTPALGTGLAVSAAVAGAVMSHWGLAMGLPSFDTLAGGATWLCGGVICLTLAALMAWAVRAGEEAWMREWGLFIVLALLGAPSFYAAMPLMAAAGVPAEYVADGHVFRLASYGQWFLLLFAFVYSTYGRATRERFAR